MSCSEQARCGATRGRRAGRQHRLRGATRGETNTSRPAGRGWTPADTSGPGASLRGERGESPGPLSRGGSAGRHLVLSRRKGRRERHPRPAQGAQERRCEAAPLAPHDHTSRPTRKGTLANGQDMLAGSKLQPIPDTQTPWRGTSPTDTCRIRAGADGISSARNGRSERLRTSGRPRAPSRTHHFREVPTRRTRPSHRGAPHRLGIIGEVVVEPSVQWLKQGAYCLEPLRLGLGLGHRARPVHMRVCRRIAQAGQLIQPVREL